MRLCSTALLVLGLATVVSAQPGGPASSRIQRKTYDFKEAKKEMEYALFVPSTYDREKKTPLMVALQWLLGLLHSPLWETCSVAYYRMLTRLLRIDIATNGAPAEGSVLIVSNHVSWVDIVVLAAIAPMVFVAKREVASWPLIGAAAKVQRVIFVDRMRRQFPTLDALIKLSEKAPIGSEVEAVLRERGNRLVTQANLGYVVIDSRFITPERAQLVIDAFRLRELQRDAHLTLYEPVIAGR